MNLKDKIKNTAEILASISEIPPEPALGIDIDGTVDEAPAFFSFLTSKWDGPVYAISYRNDHDMAVSDLKHFGIKFDGVILVNSFAQKAQYIKKLNIKVFFDDMDEVLMHIPKDVVVFKVRNGGNFDFTDRKWLYSEKTGRKL